MDYIRKYETVINFDFESELGGFYPFFLLYVYV